MSQNETIRLMDAVPVLRSAKYERSRDFYVDVLGYAMVEEGGDPPRFGIFKRDRSIIYVNAWNGGPGEHSGGWEAYIHLTGLDAYFAELKSAGAPLTRAIELTNYGMREFEVTDPDGNILCFGEDTVQD